MDRPASPQHIATRGHGWPELFLDHNAPPERHVVIADDYGQRVQMSLTQFRSIVEAATNGALGELTA